MTVKRVLSVGQCGADHSSISRVLRQSFGAEVVAADTVTEAVEQLREQAFALVLVNRIFDRDGTPGLELIQQVKSDPEVSQVPVMLVSNYADAQEEAVQVGALPGFGKASLGRPEMLQRVEELLKS
jgi:two-component system, chemotaxis family, chemotaxis protein CheY